jgi:hypothetical protein
VDRLGELDYETGFEMVAGRVVLHSLDVSTVSIELGSMHSDPRHVVLLGFADMDCCFGMAGEEGPAEDCTNPGSTFPVNFLWPSSNETWAAQVEVRLLLLNKLMPVSHVCSCHSLHVSGVVIAQVPDRHVIAQLHTSSVESYNTRTHALCMSKHRKAVLAVTRFLRE